MEFSILVMFNQYLTNGNVSCKFHVISLHHIHYFLHFLDTSQSSLRKHLVSMLTNAYFVKVVKINRQQTPMINGKMYFI